MTAGVTDHPVLPTMGSLIGDAIALDGALNARRRSAANDLARRMTARAASINQTDIRLAADHLARLLCGKAPFDTTWKDPWSALAWAIDAALDDLANPQTAVVP